jgi:diaminopimelate epimerase
MDTDVKVSVPGGELIVNYTREKVLLTGSVTYVYDGSFEY